jgi:FemAB-related protein (PEP-CTERM system-associated)
VIRVERITGAAPEWDPFVRSQPDWTPFHLLAWRDGIGQVVGHPTVYLAARGDAGLLGGLPLVLIKSPIFGRYLVSMPFVNYGGPLGAPDAVRALTDEAVRIAKAERVKLLELRSRTQLPLDLPVSHRKITVVLDMPAGSPDKLFKSFDSKLRSQVRRPQKEGITVRFGRDQVDPFYRVFARHMRDLGTPVLSKRLFTTLADTFGDDLWVGVAWHQDQPIAGGVGFRWGGEFEMTWASSLHAFNRLSPNMALYWAFMERACNSDVTLFNFGRCSVGAGSHRFKKQWGSRDEQLWWYQHGEGIAGTPSPDDGAYSWGPRLWKHLPVGIANVLGPPIVAGIP